MEALLKLIEEGRNKEALEEISAIKTERGNSDILAILEAAVWQQLDNREAMWNAICEGLLCNPKNYELYYMLGDYYDSVNEQQAWLCYENAKFYCRDDKDSVLIKERMQTIEERVTPPGKAAIILLSYNSLEMTQNCIASIRENCMDESYELIVVDNASKDESAEWLKSQQNIKLICNEENQGFPKGCNQGILLAEPESDIFLLNNDTLMMPNALFWLRMGLYENGSVGACGSVSNSAANYQQMKEVYDTLGGYIEYAVRNNIPQRHPYEERMYLIGFAMLIKREALDAVGLLDEQFTPGNFEDTDYGIRITQAGYYNRVCKNSFIFHWGGQSFGKNSDQYLALIQRNKKIFEEKHHHSFREYSVIHTDIIDKMELEKISDSFRVLDLQCGYGMTMAKIQSENSNALCYGITKEEKLPIASRYGQAISGDLETMMFDYPERYFHFIIGAEILSQITEYESFLKNVRKLLAEEGSLFLLVDEKEKCSWAVLRNLLETIGYKIRNIWYYRIQGETKVSQYLVHARK